MTIAGLFFRAILPCMATYPLRSMVIALSLVGCAMHESPPPKLFDMAVGCFLRTDHISLYAGCIEVAVNASPLASGPYADAARNYVGRVQRVAAAFPDNSPDEEIAKKAITVLAEAADDQIAAQYAAEVTPRYSVGPGTLAAAALIGAAQGFASAPPAPVPALLPPVSTYCQGMGGATISCISN